MVTVRDRKDYLSGLVIAGVLMCLAALLPVANSAEVVLTSDPPGSVICAGGKEVGITPLTLNLPAGQPVEITSRFGPLTPLTHTLLPDDNQIVAYQFKHDYATLVITCDRSDAALLIDDQAYAHPPAVVLVPPGKHKLFLSASNAPDKTRELEVFTGQRVTVEMYFSGGSPATVKTSLLAQNSPDALPPPAPLASPSPKSRGVKPSPAEQKTSVWIEPPSFVPPGVPPVNPEPGPTPVPEPKSASRSQLKTGKKRSASGALASMSRDIAKAKAVSSPRASEKDKENARAAIKETWRAKDERLKAQKAQIENKIRISTGAVREQWKYRLAVWRQKLAAAKKDQAVALAALK